MSPLKGSACSDFPVGGEMVLGYSFAHPKPSCLPIENKGSLLLGAASSCEAKEHPKGIKLISVFELTVELEIWGFTYHDLLDGSRTASELKFHDP